MIVPVDVARSFLEAEFPESYVAFLAGSVVRGEATATSDLDIVIITDREEAPYRRSYVWEGWPVEALVHNEQSYLDFFASDLLEYEPALQVMCLEGIVLRDRDGIAARIKEEARRQVEAGPAPLTPEATDRLRYIVTDLLDDLEGSVLPDESLFIANNLAVAATRLILLHNRRWIGSGKWLLRALRDFDPVLALRLGAALRLFYQSEQKEALVTFADNVLAPVGGRLFDGYFASGKKNEADA